MEHRSLNIYEKSLLLLLLAVTFLLSIKQMYPFDSFDELEIMNWIKGLNTDPTPTLKYPPLFLYLHYALSWIYDGLLSFLGIVNTHAEFLNTDFGFRFTLEAGRVVNALLAVLIVFVTFRTGKRFFNVHSGFMAALLMAVNPLVILYAHIFKPGILTALLLSILLYFLLKYLDNPKPVTIFIASLFCGLAVSAKFNAFPVALSVFLVVFLAARPVSGNNTTYPSRKISLLTVPAGAALGFFLGAPNWLLNLFNNIKRFMQQYSPEGGDLFQLFEPKSMGQIILEFMGNIIHHFGLILFVLFIAAVLWSLLTRDKPGLLIVFFILSYIVIISYFGFFAERFGLPLYPAVAVLTGKFLFCDLKKAVIKYKQANPQHSRLQWGTIALVLWVPLAIYGLNGTVDSVRTYNQLKTKSLQDRTSDYREDHNLVTDGKMPFDIARQIFTPRVMGRGNNIKLTKYFHLKYKKRQGNRPYYFVQAHLPTYRDFVTREGEPDPKAISLDRFRPFHQLIKYRYQPWNPECVFLYRVSPELADIVPDGFPKPLNLLSLAPEILPMPRTFYKSRHTTFLPLQVYEKNPGFGKLESGMYSHWIYSKKELKGLKIHFFCSGPSEQVVKVWVNRNVQSFSLKSGTVQTVEINDPAPGFFHHDYVYVLRIRPDWKPDQNEPFYFVTEPVYEDDRGAEQGKAASNESPSSNLSLNVPLDGAVPRLFSNDTVPQWVKSVYKQTAIDLSLLEFLSTETLNRDSKTVDETDIFPLQKGHYLLKLHAKANESNLDGLLLEYTQYSAKGETKTGIPLIGQWPQVIPLRVDEPLVFVKMGIKGVTLRRAAITPDYRQLLEERFKN